QKLAYPNTLDPNNKDSEFYHTQATASRIAAAQTARIRALRGKQTLPSIRNAMNSLFLAREGDAGLASLGEQLRGLQLVRADDFPDLAQVNEGGKIDDFERLARQAQIACIAFKAGVAVSVNIGMGGYDTHNDNDNQQTIQAMQLL